MKLIRFTVNPFQENTYLLIHKGKALLFDPGFSSQKEHDSLKKALEDHQATLEAILMTHAHIDHVLGVNEVVATYKVPVYLHEEDKYLWDNVSNHAALFGLAMDALHPEPKPIALGKQVWVDIEIEVRFTPGHAPGHVVYYIKDLEAVIAGDTLFQGSIGRTDLYKGDFDLLASSIRSELYTLPEHTKIYPGHGPETKVGVEMRSNPYVQVKN